MKGEVLLPANYLEVGLTPDGCEVIINHPVDPAVLEDTLNKILSGRRS